MRLERPNALPIQRPEPSFGDRCPLAHDGLARDRHVDDAGHALPAVVIDDMKHPEAFVAPTINVRKIMPSEPKHVSFKNGIINKKGFFVVEGAGHYEMYDKLQYVDQAIDWLDDFYKRYLG